MGWLIDKQVLNAKYKDHSLIGNYSGHRECHIEPDWLLIYKINDRAIVMIVYCAVFALGFLAFHK